MDDNVVALVAIIAIFGLPIGGWIIRLVFAHQERMEMLRRGIVPPPDLRGRAWREWVRQNSGMTAGPGRGAPMPPGAAQHAPWPPPPPHPAPPPPPSQWGAGDDAQIALYKGIRVALVGLGLTLGIGLVFGGYRGNPMILGGLIPLFVGIAQIIIAVLSGAQLPGVAPSVTFIPPPQQPGMGPQPPPPPPGAAAPPPWQQPGGPRFEELSKPIQPPDVR